MRSVWIWFTVLLPRSLPASGLPQRGGGLCGEAKLLCGRRLPAEGGLCLVHAVPFGLKSLDLGFEGLDGSEEPGVVLPGFAELAVLAQGAEGEDNDDGAGEEEKEKHVGEHGDVLGERPGLARMSASGARPESAPCSGLVAGGHYTLVLSGGQGGA